MTFPVLAALLCGMAPVQAQAPAPQAYVATVPVRAAESDASRIQQLRTLVQAAEKALDDGEVDTAAAKCDEADVLTADWSPELLKQAEVQGLLERLKDVQDQFADEDMTEVEPGLKAPEEVVSISGDELRAELELVRSAEQGATYDYPIDLNDKVLTWVSLFSTTKRGFMENALGRASTYLPMIRQVFAEEGVPSDLAYLAVIESGFRNEAKSRAKAVGMWQFIRSTGRIYGLTGNAWVEERRDPVKATRAAARYLKRLYELTGDWYLAASSYNAGPLTLDRAIQNLGTRNFWDLARSRWLRTETKNYVPELCAAILVGRNPGRYGLHIAPLVPYAYETVSVSSMTSLTVLARCAGTDAATLKTLNPELLRGSTPPGSYQLRVPPGKALDCLRQLAHMPAAQRLDFKTYTVRKGDTLVKVAKRFRLTTEDLLAANDITAKQFRTGRRLLVPPPPVIAVEERDLAPGTERVKALGDRPLPPLPGLPRDAEGAAEQPVKPEVPPSGNPGPAAPPSSASQKPASVVAVSTLESATPVLSLDPAAHRPEERPSRVASARVHKVQKGDTLASIARKYDLEIKDLKVWNRLKNDRIQVGQKLRLAAR